MPPKAARVGAAASGVDNPAFTFVFSVLKNCESIKPDWNGVAAENGIAYGKNATARFKSIVENHGLKFVNGRITDADDVGAATATPTAKTATPKGRGRKRKPDEEGDDESPTKKRSPAKKGGKKSQPIVKEEEASDEEEEEAQVKDEDDADGSGAEEVKA